MENEFFFFYFVTAWDRRTERKQRKHIVLGHDIEINE